EVAAQYLADQAGQRGIAQLVPVVARDGGLVLRTPSPGGRGGQGVRIFPERGRRPYRRRSVARSRGASVERKEPQQNGATHGPLPPPKQVRERDLHSPLPFRHGARLRRTSSRPGPRRGRTASPPSC